MMRERNDNSGNNGNNSNNIVRMITRWEEERAPCWLWNISVHPFVCIWFVVEQKNRSNHSDDVNYNDNDNDKNNDNVED